MGLRRRWLRCLYGRGRLRRRALLRGRSLYRGTLLHALLQEMTLRALLQERALRGLRTHGGLLARALRVRPGGLGPLALRWRGEPATPSGTQ